MRGPFRQLPEVPETPEHEAGTAIDALEAWAAQVHVAISTFRIAPAAPWQNREISVAGQNSAGEWMRNGFSVDNLSDPRELDAALIRSAIARGWAQYRIVS